MDGQNVPMFKFRVNRDIVLPGSGDAEGSTQEVVVLAHRTPFEGFGPSHFLVVMVQEEIANVKEECVDRHYRHVVSLPLSDSAVSVVGDMNWGNGESRKNEYCPPSLKDLAIAAIRSVGVMKGVDTSGSGGLVLVPGPSAQQYPKNPFGYSTVGPQAGFMRRP